MANSNVTEPMKLCNRTRSALDYLLKCKNLTTVREAFLHLGKFIMTVFFRCNHSQRSCGLVLQRLEKSLKCHEYQDILETKAAC